MDGGQAESKLKAHVRGGGIPCHHAARKVKNAGHRTGRIITYGRRFENGLDYGNTAFP